LSTGALSGVLHPASPHREAGGKYGQADNPERVATKRLRGHAEHQRHAKGYGGGSQERARPASPRNHQDGDVDGDAVAALDAKLVETTGRIIQLEAENAFLRQQIANLAEALAANERHANDQGSKLKEAESTIATLVTEKVVLETDKAEKTKLWEEAADTFAEGFDLALEQVMCVFPEADCSQFAIDFEVVDGKIVRP